MKKKIAFLCAAMLLVLAGCGQKAAVNHHVVDYEVDVPSGFESGEFEGTDNYWYNAADNSNINVVITEQDSDDQSVDGVTADILRTMLEATFKITSGGEVTITDRSFTKNDVCGVPAYQYCYDVEVNGTAMTQLIVGVSADKVYTFTYTDTTGDWLETFQESAKNIQLTLE